MKPKVTIKLRSLATNPDSTPYGQASRKMQVFSGDATIAVRHYAIRFERETTNQ